MNYYHFSVDNYSVRFKQKFYELYQLLGLTIDKIGFHDDTDGIISAAIIKALKLFEKNKPLYIPINYAFLRHTDLRNELTKSNWLAILDLPPFNKNKLALYCDHHLSNRDLIKNSKEILYDPNKASCAILLADCYQTIVPPFLRKTAELTAIIDTASFTNIPSVTNLNEVSITDLSNNELAWLLDDLCREQKTLMDIISLVNDFSDKGIIALSMSKYKTVYQKIFQKRILTCRQLENIDVTEVLAITIKNDKINVPMISNWLFRQNVMVICYIYPLTGKALISLRLNPFIDPQEALRLRVDVIAEKFGGGGHIRSAGCELPSEKQIIRYIRRWTSRNSMKFGLLTLE